MKTRILPMLIFMSLFAQFTFAQSNEFSWKDYQYPDLKRTTLTTYFDLFNNAEVNSATGVNDYDLKSKSNFRIDVGFNYWRRINTRKWQSNVQATFGDNFAFSKNKTFVDTVFSTNANNYSVRLSSDNRRYFKQNYFVELNPEIRSNISRLKNINGADENLSKNSLYQLEVKLGVGKGRLEFVGDVHQAMFTLEDLENTGMLQRDVNEEDIKLISDKIAELKNVRFFDSRHKIIYQFVQLDSLLQSRGLLTQGDAASTAILYDNWRYAFRPFRYAGQRFSFGAIEKAFWSKSQDGIDDPIVDANFRRIDIGAYVEYSYERPVNLNWQHSLLSRLEWNRRKAKNLLEEIDSDAFHAGYGTIHYTLSYYPNTRTRFSGGGLISSSVNLSLEELSLNDLNYRANLFFNADYYISPQFRMSASYDLGYINRSPNLVPSFPAITGITFNSGLFSRLDVGLDYFFW